MFQARYPQGDTRREEVGGEWEDVAVDPLYQTGDDTRKLSMQASLKEDEALRGQLGHRRKRQAGEREGTYSEAYYPQLNAATNWAATGNMPLGGGGGPMWIEEQQNPDLREANSRKRRQWAAYQKALLGMGGMR